MHTVARIPSDHHHHHQRRSLEKHGHCSGAPPLPRKPPQINLKLFKILQLVLPFLTSSERCLKIRAACRLLRSLVESPEWEARAMCEYLRYEYSFIFDDLSDPNSMFYNPQAELLREKMSKLHHPVWNLRAALLSNLNQGLPRGISIVPLKSTDVPLEPDFVACPGSSWWNAPKELLSEMADELVAQPNYMKPSDAWDLASRMLQCHLMARIETAAELGDEDFTNTIHPSIASIVLLKHYPEWREKCLTYPILLEAWSRARSISGMPEVHDAFLKVDNDIPRNAEDFFSWDYVTFEDEERIRKRKQPAVRQGSKEQKDPLIHWDLTKRRIIKAQCRWMRHLFLHVLRPRLLPCCEEGRNYLIVKYQICSIDYGAWLELYGAKEKVAIWLATSKLNRSNLLHLWD